MLAEPVFFERSCSSCSLTIVYPSFPTQSRSICLCFPTIFHLSTRQFTLSVQKPSYVRQLCYLLQLRTASFESSRKQRREMLSNPLRRYSPYFNSSSGQDANISTPQPYASTYKIDSFGHGSSYSFHQPQQQLDPSTPQSVGPNLQPKRPLEKGEQTSGANQKLSGVAAAPVRRRISRACDQCNQLRTKCDGQHPCAHCIG